MSSLRTQLPWHDTQLQVLSRTIAHGSTGSCCWPVHMWEHNVKPREAGSHRVSSQNSAILHNVIREYSGACGVLPWACVRKRSTLAYLPASPPPAHRVFPSLISPLRGAVRSTPISCHAAHQQAPQNRGERCPFGWFVRGLHGCTVRWVTFLCLLSRHGLTGLVFCIGGKMSESRAKVTAAIQVGLGRV